MIKKVTIAAAVLLPLLIYKLFMPLITADGGADPASIITLGTMSGWPPYVSINNNGDYEGLDIDIAKEIANKLGKKLCIVDMDTVALISALNTGKVDFVMTGLSITKERLQQIEMVPYQGEEIKELPLVFWKKIPKEITSLKDLGSLSGVVVCVEPGSAQESILEQFSGFTIKKLDPSASILEIKYGKATAVLLEYSLFVDFKSKYPELVALNIPLDDQNTIMGNGIGIKKDNKKLISQIEQIVSDLKATGFIKKCEDRWLKLKQAQA